MSPFRSCGLVLALAGVAWCAQAQQSYGNKPAAADTSAAEAAFKRADTNKDGRLTKEEAERLPAIAAKFDEVDLNHDHSLTLEEFIAAYTAKQ
jgi:Ca2+-binding EF-hand superfamily protein